MNEENQISLCIKESLNRYLADLEGQQPEQLYHMVMQNAERSLIEFVIQLTKGNQSTAAQILGINRNTLRRKLTEYQLINK